MRRAGRYLPEYVPLRQRADGVAVQKCRTGLRGHFTCRFRCRYPLFDAAILSRYPDDSGRDGPRSILKPGKARAFTAPVTCKSRCVDKPPIPDPEAMNCW